MTLEDVKRILEAEVIAGDNLLHRDVRTACGRLYREGVSSCFECRK